MIYNLHLRHVMSQDPQCTLPIGRTQVALLPQNRLVP